MIIESFIAGFNILPISISPLVSTACAGVLCYMLGRYAASKAEERRIELERRASRTKGLAEELQRITDVLRQDIKAHRENLELFKGHLASTSHDKGETHTHKMKSAAGKPRQSSMHSE